MSSKTLGVPSLDRAPGPRARRPASTAPAAAPAIRPATLRDVPELMRIEAQAFETDRLNAQSLRNLIKNDTASVIVAESTPGGLAGYCVVLFRKGTAVARLYSMATDTRVRGTGVARALMGAMEADAKERGSLFLRLEVRPDNAAAIRLYESFGYKPFGRHFQYYEDDTDALRYEKSLLAQGVRSRRRVPYYAQTSDFTCGPATMLMAMAALDPETRLGRPLEFRLWREATTIVMTAGVGGCDPVGMAVALARRGFKASVHATESGPLFLDTVRSPWKRQIMTIAQEDFRREAKDLKVPIRIGALSLPRLRQVLSEGGIVIVLISPYRLYHERVPHWVVAYEADERHVFVHDPWLDPDETESPLAKAALAIPLKELERISVYGKSRLRAAVVVEAGPRGGAEST